MPKQIHSAPRATLHHQAADASRAPARIVSRAGSGVFRSLVIANFLWVMPRGQGVDRSCPRRGECCKKNWGFLTPVRLGGYELSAALTSLSA